MLSFKVNFREEEDYEDSFDIIIGLSIVLLFGNWKLWCELSSFELIIHCIAVALGSAVNVPLHGTLSKLQIMVLPLVHLQVNNNIGEK